MAFGAYMILFVLAVGYVSYQTSVVYFNMLSSRRLVYPYDILSAGLKRRRLSFGPRADGCTRLQDVGAGIFPMGEAPGGGVRWAQLVIYPIIYGSYFCSIFLIYYPGLMMRWKWTFYLLLAVLTVLLFASLNVATAGFVQLAYAKESSALAYKQVPFDYIGTVTQAVSPGVKESGARRLWYAQTTLNIAFGSFSAAVIVLGIGSLAANGIETVQGVPWTSDQVGYVFGTAITLAVVWALLLLIPFGSVFLKFPGFPDNQGRCTIPKDVVVS